MTRPFITIEDLKKVNEALYTVSHSVFTLLEFKEVFELQTFEGGYHALIKSLGDMSKYPSIAKRFQDYANSNKNYNRIMLILIDSYDFFGKTTIPTRASDFIVQEQGIQDTFFWIEERLEITHDIKNNAFCAAKLMVDDKNDSLLFNNGEDGWMEYKDHKDHTSTGTQSGFFDFSTKVSYRYKEFLAEKQLLKD